MRESGESKDRQKANTKDEDPTGLLNEGMRYRDLETGVWLTRDPAGFVDGPNLYAYVVQNPWSKFDPDGLESFMFPPQYFENSEFRAGFNRGAGDTASTIGRGIGKTVDFVWNLTVVPALTPRTHTGVSLSKEAQESYGNPMKRIFGYEGGETMRQATEKLAEPAQDAMFAIAGAKQAPKIRAPAPVERPITNQEAIDAIHSASFGSSNLGNRVPMTLTEPPSGGNPIISKVGGKPDPKARAMAEEIFGAGNVYFVSGGLRNGHHSEARGIGPLLPKSLGARQWSTHYACPDCETMQKSNGVINETGFASDNGGKITREKEVK